MTQIKRLFTDYPLKSFDQRHPGSQKIINETPGNNRANNKGLLQCL